MCCCCQLKLRDRREKQSPASFPDSRYSNDNENWYLLAVWWLIAQNEKLGNAHALNIEYAEEDFYSVFGFMDIISHFYSTLFPFCLFELFLLLLLFVVCCCSCWEWIDFAKLVHLPVTFIWVFQFFLIYFVVIDHRTISWIFLIQLMAMESQFERRIVGNILFGRWHCPQTNSHPLCSTIGLHHFPVRISNVKHCYYNLKFIISFESSQCNFEIAHLESKFTRILWIEVVQCCAVGPIGTWLLLLLGSHHRCLSRRSHWRWQWWCCNIIHIHKHELCWQEIHKHYVVCCFFVGSYRIQNEFYYWYMMRTKHS